jgi:hypothetical protein
MTRNQPNPTPTPAVDAPSVATTRAEAYTLRMPRAPATQIRAPESPLNLAAATGPSNPDLALGPPVHNPDPALNVDFLANLRPPAHEPADDDVVFWGPRGAGVSWTYDMRRASQPVLPHLRLGPLSSARDPAVLRAQGVTLVLAIRPPNGAVLVAAAARAAQAAGIRLRDVEAAGRDGLVQAFPVATRAINAHVAAAGPAGKACVLLCCESGNMQAAAVAAAYLMETYQGVDVTRAVHICMARRFACSFDEVLVAALKIYEDIVRARREVMAMAGTGGAGKRGRDQEMHEVDDGEFQDTERFVGRVHAPFL